MTVCSLCHSASLTVRHNGRNLCGRCLTEVLAPEKAAARLAKYRESEWYKQRQAERQAKAAIRKAVAEKAEAELMALPVAEKIGTPARRVVWRIDGQEGQWHWNRSRSRLTSAELRDGRVLARVFSSVGSGSKRWTKVEFERENHEANQKSQARVAAVYETSVLP